jgi:hypothetical protein
MPLTGFDPHCRVVRPAFHGPTEPRAQGWPEIRAARRPHFGAHRFGQDARRFLICLDSLVRRAPGESDSQTQVLYVSAAKALSNDVRKNLEIPPRKLPPLPGPRHSPAPIRTAVRTGDTPMWEREKNASKLTSW